MGQEAALVELIDFVGEPTLAVILMLILREQRQQADRIERIETAILENWVSEVHSGPVSSPDGQTSMLGSSDDEND